MFLSTNLASVAFWVLTLLVTSRIIVVLYFGFTSPLRRLPGPWYTAFTNLPLKIAVVTGRRIYYIHDLHRKYGPIVRISPSEIAIAELESFKQIHRIGTPFLKSPWYAKLNSCGKDRLGVFAMSDPKQHASRRKVFARAFSKTHLRQYWESVVKGKVQLAIAAIKRDLDEKGKADVLQWWACLATDISAHLMFGESFGMLERGEKNEYMRVLENTLKGSGIAVEFPFVRHLSRILPIQSLREMFQADEFVFSYGSIAVEKAKQADHSANIFATAFAESEKGNEGLTDQDVRQEAGNLIVAGSDTTSITMTYLIWAVLNHPHVRKMLEDEVSCIEDMTDVSDAQLEELPYLNAVINETLRLYGAAPGSLPRVTPECGARIGEFHVPGGTTVSTQSWTMHRDASYFTNPELFDPSRWLHETSKDARAAFSPFGAGSRVCLGVHLAMMELRFATASFFYYFRGTRLADSTTPKSMEPENYFLIAPREHRCEITY